MNSLSSCREEGAIPFRLLKLMALAALLSPGPPAFALNPARLLDQYIRDRWTDERGFPGGAVYAFAQTPDGYLWIGGDEGLVRFDGLNFQLFNHVNTPALSESPVLDLAVDSQGSLWIRMQNRDVARYRRGEFDTASLPHGVTSMTQGAGGEVLLIRENAVIRCRGESVVSAPQPAGWRLGISIALTSDGTLWEGTRDAGLFGLKAGRNFVVRGLPDTKIDHLLPGEGNTLWIGTDHGLAKWNGSSLALQSLPAALKSAQVLALARDRDSNLWLGTPHGLMRLAADGTFAADPAGRNDAVNSIFEDREGDLWVGRSQGIERYRDSAFLTYPAGGGSLYIDHSGRAWEAPSQGGLFRLENSQWQAVSPNVFGDDVVYSIDGGPNEIWAGRQRGGLTRLRIQDGSITETLTAADGLAKGSIYAVRRSRNGTVWAGSLGGGVSRISNGDVTTYTTANGLASNTISAIEEGADGTIWVATPEGLSGFAQGRWHSVGNKEGLPPGRINCLVEDSAGILWIGTDMGLAFVRDGQAQTPRDVAGTVVDQILGIADDGRNGLWVATPKFVARLARSQLLGQRGDAGPIRIFGPTDGIPAPEGVRRDRSVVNDSAGRIWFSLRRGVSWVDPARVATGASAPVAHVESVSVDGTALDPAARVKVPAGQRRIRFEYLAISLSVPELVRYRYRLENFDHDWSEPAAARETVYANLGPGSYRFRVIAGNGQGAWSTTESFVDFEVAPALWQTTWFRALVVPGCCLLAFAFYRMRLRRLKRMLAIRFEERLAERTRIGQELQETLLQGLLATSMQFQMAVDSLPDDRPLRSRFERALAMLQQVVDEARNAVRGLHSPGSGAHELEAAFSRVREEIAAAKAVDFRIVVDGKSRPLNPLVRDEIYRIGREALINAFRHSGSPLIEMQIHYNDSLRVMVLDWGRGFNERDLQANATERCAGLVEMRDRAEEMGARLRVRSKADGGTEVVLIVPGRIAFPRAELSLGFESVSESTDT